MLHRIPTAAIVALLGWLAAALPASAQDKGAKELAKKLGTKVTLENGIEANTPLKDALEFLAEKHDLTIVVDEKAFEKVGVPKVSEQPVSLKPVKNMELGKVLQKLLDPLEGTYKIDKNRVLILPKPKK